MTTNNLDWVRAFTFLHHLAPNEKTHTFQIFPETADAKELSANGKAPGKWEFIDKQLMDVWNAIELANHRGFAVSVTVNELVAGYSRSGENIKTIRAVWLDDDGDAKPVETFPLSPSITVETSPGRYHRYWLVADEWSALGDGRDDFNLVMRSIVDLYGGDRQAIDIGRVLRLPGTLNQKSGLAEPFLVRVATPVDCDPVRYSREQIVSAFVMNPEKVLVME